MRVARWRWAVVPMVVLVAACLPQPPPRLPPSFISEYYGGSRPAFTVQPPPAENMGKEIVAALRADPHVSHVSMFRGRAVPVFGVFDCQGVPNCTGAEGPPRAVWLVLYPDCTDATGDFGWALVSAERAFDPGYSWTAPCAPSG